ncbi:uncharacterized protein [Onthophagus taurus]|uniref:uncharacterized protein n=1 Tax=Onthophagus taurus TaxID=166361 RepID=UPI000C2069C5|nr:leucine-rich repeat extensin-like protein 5 [Onthophagus taurus]
MVCKEDILSWFKNLDCYKRIDVMHDLLNICMPYELRFIGSCLEEIGKHTYQELRGVTLIANDVDKLAKDNLLNLSTGLLDEVTRNRAVLHLSLLSSRNCVGADWLFKSLFRTEVFEDFIVKGNCKDESLQNEFLLLLTMGVHHPAFTFDQKYFLGRLIERLLEQKEHRNEATPKISNFCIPPGFPYQQPPPVISSHSEIHVIPSNQTMVIGSGEGPQHPPPGLPIHTVHPPMDLIWQRPTLGGNICVPSEVPPFPAPSLSPLVSQPGSPPPSRANSPHRNYTLRPVGGIPLTHNLEMQSNPSPMNVDTISTSSLIPKYLIKEDEPNHMQEDKLRSDQKWMKPPNGLISYIREPNYFCHQMQALKLEGENSLHRSTSSSNSSLNQSPPQTPTTAIVSQHGPGRGVVVPDQQKPRLNGVPPFMTAGPPPPPESTPPPPPTMSNVPYMNFPAPPPPISITMPNRCFISYPRHPPYTPGDTPFTTPNDQQQHYTTASPYLQFPFRISSMQQPAQQQQPQHRNLPTTNCYNCGALGHNGTECTSQTIDDITQKPYALEYTQMSSDGDK